MDKRQSKGQVLTKTKLPSQVFNQCPGCDSRNIYKFEGEVFCFSCDWNSIANHVWSRSLGFGMFRRPAQTVEKRAIQETPTTASDEANSELIVA